MCLHVEKTEYKEEIDDESHFCERELKAPEKYRKIIRITEDREAEQEHIYTVVKVSPHSLLEKEEKVINSQDTERTSKKGEKSAVKRAFQNI